VSQTGGMQRRLFGSRCFHTPACSLSRLVGMLSSFLVHAPSHMHTRAAPAPVRPDKNGFQIRFLEVRLRGAPCMHWTRPVAEHKHPNNASQHLWSLAGLLQGNQTGP
jgi:hypothetical protein